jgi:hypothetical protein
LWLFIFVIFILRVQFVASRGDQLHLLEIFWILTNQVKSVVTVAHQAKAYRLHNTWGTGEQVEVRLMGKPALIVKEIIYFEANLSY